jgi:hypothetical protein
MRKRLLCLLVLVAVVVAVLAERSTVAGGADKTKSRKRVKMDCATYREGMERMAKSAGIPLKLAPGSWGTVPAALRALPPGAEFCGATDAGPVVVVSPLYGKEIEAHYAPLFAKVGCQPFTCDVSAFSTVCTCKGKDARGRVETDSDIEAFSLLLQSR